ncbi:MAG: thiamine-phosphate kinase [Synechococcales bacterium]|nr:thiamine-phosphate kinase [Synechococcales bacterium]
MESDWPMLSVGNLGEQGLLARLQQFCPSDVVGDDAAVLSSLQTADLVVTTDLLVDQVHFSDRTTPPHAVGWRAVAANLSDLAAMGATPIALTVGLGLPGETAVAWVEHLYQGMVDCLAQFGGQIVGGDLVRSPQRTLAITAFGQVQPDRVIRRSQAQVGDLIVVTGYHGNSRAGLELLLQPNHFAPIPSLEGDRWIEAHQYPRPRLDAIHQLGQRLAGDFTQNPKSFRIAGMDSSDGLADAVLQICRASGVGAELDYRKLPIDPSLARHFPDRAVEWCLYGGEDFELVLCLPPQIVHPFLDQFIAADNPGATIIGKIIAPPEVNLVDPQQLQAPQRLTLEKGFQHF